MMVRRRKLIGRVRSRRTSSWALRRRWERGYNRSGELCPKEGVWKTSKQEAVTLQEGIWRTHTVPRFISQPTPKLT